MKRLEAIARRVSNWGRWGPDDERGTLNHITPDVVRRAAATAARARTSQRSITRPTTARKTSSLLAKYR